MPLPDAFRAAVGRAARPRRGDRRARAAAHLRVRRADGPPRDAGARRPARHGRGRRRRSSASATSTACRSSRAAPGRGSRAARCRSPTASSSRSRGSNRILEVDLEHAPRRRRAGRDEPRDHEGGRGRRLLLRARPVEPAGLHDRRQRGRELGRRALPEVRLHRQPRARRRRRAAGRRARHALARRRRARPARRVRRLRGDARDRGARHRAACVRVAESVRTLLAAFHSTDAAGEAVSRTIAAGILPAAIEMMDALTLEAVEAAIAAAATRPARARC